MEGAWNDVALGQVGSVGKSLVDDKTYCIMKFSNPSAVTFFNY